MSGSVLHDRQVLLVRCLAKLFAYATERGYELTLGEGYVQKHRPSTNKVWFMDAMHMPESLHYQRLAIDLNLFVEGSFVTSSESLAWKDLGEFWEKLDPLCAWGGRFSDGNHLSVRFGDKA